MSEPLHNRDCPLCGAAETTPLPQYSRDEWRVGACASCGFVYLENPPDYERLTEEFAWEKTYAAERKRRKQKMPVVMWLDEKTRWRLTLFGKDEGAKFRRIFSGKRVLDVGCGEGDKVPEPFTPYGVEISNELHARADALMKARGGYAVHAPAVEGVASFPDAYFDGIMLRSFLEHEKNPLGLLSEASRVLAPGGRVFVKVPNYGGINRRVMGGKWCGFRHPDHVSYFTLGSLKAMAAKAGLGFKLLNPVNLPLDDNIHAVLVKPGG
ncbi:MAG: class I SAM-dependent methyltransferase [Caulobacteraceae bacterium]